MSETWIILGATSSMARAFARKCARKGDALLLLGRDMPELKRIAKDCSLRGAAQAEAVAFDARKPEEFSAIISEAAEGRQLNAAVFIGSMPPQDELDRDPSLLDGVIQDNFTGPARFLQLLAPHMETQGSGTIIGIGSVAGDRGRVGNYVYGAAKAGFHTYLSGLRNRLGRHGVQVITVKPGFVDTTMTWGIEGMFLVASPEAVADSLIKAVKKRRNVVYTPWFWRYIMLIIRHIPEFIFKKMSI
ncbi:MAG: SDR family oxidoreductase [Rhodobacteraceae bacterium]|nr:SDR family oxidoreductase [Paracoccaceae bacterium]